MIFTKKQILGLCIISGALLAFPFLSFGSALIGFVAWFAWFCVDEFYFVNKQSRRSSAVFWWAYLTFVVWNGASTWWIYNASFAGALMAVLFNPVFMAAAVWLAHFIKRKAASRLVGYVAFVSIWLSYEWMHLNWDLSWPWLMLGNGFANSHNLVQWYEFTGVLGGSLWMLVVNILVFEAFRRYRAHEKIKNIALTLGLSVALPIVISCFVPIDKCKTDTVNVVIVQPNVDPYGSELETLSPDALVNRLLAPAEKSIMPQTKFVLLPECVLPGFIWENNLDQHFIIQAMIRWSAAHHNIAIVTGATTGIGYNCSEKPTKTARGSSSSWYDVFNSALYLKAGCKPQIYHKSQLVLGVEKMPLASILPFLKPLSEMLGGSANSLGVQEQRIPFRDNELQMNFAPVICYESVYGAFVARYCRASAQAVFLITNDGWWGDTPGYKQHLSFSRLRAIESRRAIVRCANTGVSGLVLPSGELTNQTAYGVLAVRNLDVPINSGLTFYARMGDWLGAFSLFVLLGVVFVTAWRMRKK